MKTIPEDYGWFLTRLPAYQETPYSELPYGTSYYREVLTHLKYAARDVINFRDYFDETYVPGSATLWSRVKKGKRYESYVAHAASKIDRGIRILENYLSNVDDANFRSQSKWLTTTFYVPMTVQHPFNPRTSANALALALDTALVCTDIENLFDTTQAPYGEEYWEQAKVVLRLKRKRKKYNKGFEKQVRERLREALNIINKEKARQEARRELDIMNTRIRTLQFEQLSNESKAHE